MSEDTLFAAKKYGEQVFSYLLVNTGYLTLRSQNGEYLMRIPNYEVEREFLRVIQGELRYIKESMEDMKDVETLMLFAEQKKLLEQHIITLQYHNQVGRLIKAILGEDARALEMLFAETPGLTCDGSNFNLFHIGALTGDTGVFAAILGRCDLALLNIPDKIYDLYPIDYANLSGNRKLMAEIKQATPQHGEIAIRQPSVIEAALCSPAGVIDIGKVAVVPLISVLPRILGPNIPQLSLPQWLLAIAMLTNTATKLINYLSSDKLAFCQEYNKYAKIYTTDPAKFDSLAQFEKYIFEGHPGYVTVNENCNAESTAISHISWHYDSHHQGQNLDFNLCMMAINATPELT